MKKDVEETTASNNANHEKQDDFQSFIGDGCDGLTDGLSRGLSGECAVATDSDRLYLGAAGYGKSLRKVLSSIWRVAYTFSSCSSTTSICSWKRPSRISSGTSAAS